MPLRGTRTKILFLQEIGFFGGYKTGELFIMHAKFETFFVKALYEAKIEELVNTYREKHFSAKKHVQMGYVEFDPVVKQGYKILLLKLWCYPYQTQN